MPLKTIVQTFNLILWLRTTGQQPKQNKSMGITASPGQGWYLRKPSPSCSSSCAFATTDPYEEVVEQEEVTFPHYPTYGLVAPPIAQKEEVIEEELTFECPYCFKFSHMKGVRIDDTTYSIQTDIVNEPPLAFDSQPPPIPPPMPMPEPPMPMPKHPVGYISGNCLREQMRYFDKVYYEDVKPFLAVQPVPPEFDRLVNYETPSSSLMKLDSYHFAEIGKKNHTCVQQQQNRYRTAKKAIAAVVEEEPCFFLRSSKRLKKNTVRYIETM